MEVWAVPFLHDSDQSTFKVGIVFYPAFFQLGEGLCGIQLCPMLDAALLRLEIVKRTDTVVTLLRLFGRSGASSNPDGDGVVYTQGFHSGKQLLIRNATGYIFTPLYLIAFLL